MKRFMAVYIGTTAGREKSGWDSLSEEERKEKEQAGMDAWMKWGDANKDVIVDIGGPLGKTKRTSSRGVEDIRNSLAGYIIVQAESHEAAARLFEGHPHFTIFPGDSVEIMECLPIPTL
jgi:hypothetical protein